MIDIGPGVSRFRVGDRVHLPLLHRQTHAFHEDLDTAPGQISPLPAGFQPEQWIFLALAGVALQAVHDAQPFLGLQRPKLIQGRRR